MWLTRTALVFAVAALSQQTPTFRAGVALTTIDVTILDKDGRPVEGLTAGDIEIKLNGQVQPIRAFAFVKAATPAPAAAPPMQPSPAPVAHSTPVSTGGARRTISNQSAVEVAAPAPIQEAVPAPAPGESRTFVLVVDDLSFAPSRGRNMFAAAQRFLDRVPASDPVGFTTTSGIGAVNPTRDRAVVRAALSKVMGQFNDPRGMHRTGPSGGGRVTSTNSPLGISESLDIERGDDRMLAEVIGRECFYGQTGTQLLGSLAQLLAENACASDVRREARQIGALIRQNRTRQIDGLRAVINAMRSATGIRHVVLLSEGVPVSRDVNDLRPLVRAAAEAGVQLSVLMQEPDISATDEGRGEVPLGAQQQIDPGVVKRRREDDFMMTSGLQTMTGMLGGTFHRVVGTADPFFDRVVVESSAIYRLGVEMPPGGKSGDVFEVSVAVKREGVTARANRYSIAASATPPAPAPPVSKPATPSGSGIAASLDDTAKRALERNTPAGAIPIRIAAYQRRSASAPGQVDVNVSVAIPASAGTPLNTYVGVVDAKGALRSSGAVLHAPETGGYEPSFMFPLPPGEYRIRYAAVNERREIGTVELPITVRLEAGGGFTFSDVLTWYVDAENKAKLFALEDIPAAIETLRASIEIYPPAGVGFEPPVVRWSIAPEGGTPSETRDVQAQMQGGVLRADAEFPVAALAPGRYMVRAELLAGGQVAAVKSAVVRR